MNGALPPVRSVAWAELRATRAAQGQVTVFSIFDLAALLLTLSALFGWLNHRFLRLPHTIGLLVMGLAASLALIALDLAFPDQHLYEDLTQVLQQVDFTEVVMNGMLAFLLFAGAMSLDLRALRDRAWPVATLALLGTVISTGLVGGAVPSASGDAADTRNDSTFATTSFSSACDSTSARPTSVRTSLPGTGDIVSGSKRSVQLRGTT